MVIVQPNIDRTTFWTKSFLEIKDLWESFANDNDLDIGGHLNPYGVSMELKGAIGDCVYTFKVSKQLRNTRGSEWSWRSLTYSNIITIYSQKQVRSDKRITVFPKRNLFLRFINLFRRWEVRKQMADVVVLANHPVDPMQVETLVEDKGFYRFKIKRNAIYYKRIEQVESRERLDEVMDAIIGLL
jgi:hypothetical protein